MSFKPAARIECDGGCGSYVYGPTSADARVLATEAGWTFPAQIKSNGQASQRSNDVCSTCSPGFSPRMSRRSAAWAEMTREERRLVTFLRMNWNFVSPEERARLEAKLAEMRAK